MATISIPLRSLAETLREKLAAVPGLADLQVEKQVLIPEVRISVDHERAALYGLTASAVTEAIEGLSSGRVVSQVIDGAKRFDVVVRSPIANARPLASAISSSRRRPA